MHPSEETDMKLIGLISCTKRLVEYIGGWYGFVSISGPRSIQFVMVREFCLLYKRVRDFCGHELFDENIKMCQAECDAKDKGNCTLCLKEPAVEYDLCKSCIDSHEEGCEEDEREAMLQELMSIDFGGQKH